MSVLAKCANVIRYWWSIVAGTTSTAEFQMYTLSTLVYNYIIVLLIANQDIHWVYNFKDSTLAERFGVELTEPVISSKFGFFYRVITVIMNTCAIVTIISPIYENRKFLLPCVLWNLYTATALAGNVIEITRTMLMLEVSPTIFSTAFMVAIIMIAFQAKLIIQLFRFYEYLNYQTKANTGKHD